VGPSGCVSRSSASDYPPAGKDRLNKLSGQATAELLKSRGAEAISVHADVSVEGECRHFARAAVDASGRIDLLVANAGVARSRF
jgi:NAD(P)-dependent dehydrogenase (short-subunit alcohol dehydrogenase family)